jgi:predicted transcriptional regulator
MDIETLQTMVKGQPNDQLVNDLSANSQLLPDLERQFYRLFSFEDSEVVSFYETNHTRSAEVNIHISSHKRSSVVLCLAETDRKTI